LECNNRLFRSITTTSEDEEPQAEAVDQVSLPVHLKQFVSLLKSPSIYHHHVLHYISGFICRKLSELSRCNACKVYLMKSDLGESTSDSSMFTRRRDNGGLIYSSDMTRVITAADQSLRSILTDRLGPVKSVDHHLKTKVYQHVLKAVGTQVFQEVWHHGIDCHVIASEGSHVSQIIRGAVNIFCNMMIHHHEGLLNDRFVNKDQGTKRHKLTKTVIFLHQ